MHSSISLSHEAPRKATHMNLFEKLRTAAAGARSGTRVIGIDLGTTNIDAITPTGVGSKNPGHARADVRAEIS